jgi:hypothetical protein
MLKSLVPFYAWTNSCGGCISAATSMIVVKLAGDGVALMFPVIFYLLSRYDHYRQM